MNESDFPMMLLPLVLPPIGPVAVRGFKHKGSNFTKVTRALMTSPTPPSFLNIWKSILLFSKIL